jgi:uncharacterized protein
MSIAGHLRVVLAPGLRDSGPGHWQTRWLNLYPEFERMRQERWDAPDLHAWTRSLMTALRASVRPAIVVAHSFGCLAAVQCAAAGAPGLAGVLLVAPADPQRFALDTHFQDLRLRVPAILIGSGNDPWMDRARALHWAKQWDCEYVHAGLAGHINADSELGDWLFGLAQLQRLTHRLERPRRIALVEAAQAGV